MKRNYKTEIDPSPEQILKIHKTIDTCNYVYNFYIQKSEEMYRSEHNFLSGYKFSVWLNNEYLPEHPELLWIKEVSSKSVKQSINYAYKTYVKFAKKEIPTLNLKKTKEGKMYFVKTDKKAVIWCERHRIKIPTLGWVKIKEKGYIPTSDSGKLISSGTVSYRNGRYYVSVVIEENGTISERKEKTEGLGIDLGIINFATLSNGMIFKNIYKSTNIVRKKKQKLKQERKLSYKYLKEKKGKATNNNIEKQKAKLQKSYADISNVKNDYVNKVIATIIKQNPKYITVESLYVKGMTKNKYMRKLIYPQGFYTFVRKLKLKCAQNNIELRMVDRFFPSSKMCHNCGKIKKDLKLSDRVYKCDCGYCNDRDINASLNLRDAKVYKIIT